MLTNYANIASPLIPLSHVVVRNDTFQTLPVDVSSYKGAEFIIIYGLTTDTIVVNSTDDNSIRAKLQESDTENGTYTDVSADDVLDGRTTSLNSFGEITEDDDTPGVYAIGYTGTKRWVRVSVTFEDAHSTGLIIGVYAILILPGYVAPRRVVSP